MNWTEALEIDWANLSENSFFKELSTNKTKEERQERKHALQTQEIHSGGTEETRFSRFSEYAGHQIRQARFGHQTEDEAHQSVHLWVQDKMVPAWDKGRVDAEFRALLQRDKVNHADTWAERNKPPITLTAPTPYNAGPVPVADPAQYGIGSAIPSLACRSMTPRWVLAVCSFNPVTGLKCTAATATTWLSMVRRTMAASGQSVK